MFLHKRHRRLDGPLLAPALPYTGHVIQSSEVIILVLVGLVAGGLGGLLGIGGSIVMIPVLTIILGRNQHLSQAAAMIVNVFVALPSMIQHHREGAVRWDAVWRVLPFGVVFIIVGVESSNALDPRKLQLLFGVFLLYVIYMNVMKLFSADGEPAPADQKVAWWTCGFVGSVTGFMAGLLGIGGGIITVPLLQRACRLPLRQCIASSAAIMVLTAVVGAFRKNMALADAPVVVDEVLRWQDALILALCFIPTAIVGGLLGARLTHALKLGWVRLAFILLLCWASWQMLGLEELFGKAAQAFPNNP